MAGLKLNHIYKVYPNGAKAVNDFCMDIQDKEFIVFVGPSGCGKSTTLRMIAGLEEITAGELTMDGVVMNDMESKDRDIAMVFQNYALYPHMTVYENMAFGLKMRKVPKDVIDAKIKEAAEILGITEYLKRKPAAMSGGQRQRVALGRAIVREPKVFLLDEPLSNLDAKLRTAMRSEISKLHHKLQTTFIYVTHDQVEAMTMGTRIVVMKDGFVQQVDTPRNLYRFPENKFVAGFIGTPQMNFFGGKLALLGDKVRVTFDNTDVVLDAPASLFDKADRKYLDGAKQLVLGIRAEHVSVNPDLYPYKAKCKVSHVEELGTECLVFADFNLESADTVTESPTRVIVKAPAGTDYSFGEVIDVSLDLTYLRAFDSETENTIVPRIPQFTEVDGEVSGGKLTMLGAKSELPPAMKVPDGKYRISFPIKAIKIGGKIKAKVKEQENVNGQRLLHLQVADRTLFVLDESADPDTVSDISIDLKQLTFSDGLGYEFSAVPDENALSGKLSKHKEVRETQVNGKTKKSKHLVYNLEIAGFPFACGDEKAARIVAGGGSSVFNKQLRLTFSPYVVKIAEEGIAAEVEEILDYGEEKFAKCKVGEVAVFVKTDGAAEEKQVKLSIDAESAVVIEEERNIRLA